MQLEKPTEALLTAHALGKRYGARRVIENVSLTIQKGEIISLIGPNGAGKTTLLKLLLGLEKPDSGTVSRMNGLKIGYVPQYCRISPAMPLRVRDFLALGQPKHKLKQEVVEALGIGAWLDSPMHGLSGGEMRRVLIARALEQAPDLLVLDEPVAGVDLAGQSELYKRIRSLASARRMAVLMVSHDLFVVMAGANRVVCLNHHICCEGKPDHVGSHPEFVALFGSDVAGQLATYAHHHDHHHSVDGEVIPGAHGKGCTHA